MNGTAIFGLQVVTNLLIATLVARWYLLPRLRAIPLEAALIPLLLFHMLRTMGVVFVLPQVIGDTLPPGFAVPGALGDLLAVILAGLALIALRQQWRIALGLVWLFNIVGTLDFVNAFAQGIRHDIAEQYQLGATWFIPTFFVPAFFVTHMVMFSLLVQQRVAKAQREHGREVART